MTRLVYAVLCECRMCRASPDPQSRQGLSTMRAAARISVFFLILFVLFFARRWLILAAAVLGAALVCVARASSSGCNCEARPAPCYVVNTGAADGEGMQRLLAGVALFLRK